MSKAKPRKWPEKGRLVWVEWRDACDAQGSDDDATLAVAYTFGLFMGMRYEKFGNRKKRVLVMAYNWFDIPDMDKMSVLAANVVRWGYGRVPKRILDKH